MNQHLTDRNLRPVEFPHGHPLNSDEVQVFERRNPADTLLHQVAALTGIGGYIAGSLVTAAIVFIGGAL